MQYYSTTFKIHASDETLLQACRELLADALCECGYESFVDTEDGVEGYVQIDGYDESAVNAVIEDFPIEGVEITFLTQRVEDHDWNQTWEQEEGFSPICINDGSIIIYDALHTDPAILSVNPLQKDESRGGAIAIEARNAFGTGTHETTQMLVSCLDNMALDGKRVLDCGCGTGILGITALKCGAVDAVGYDIDEWSVENTRHNAEINGVSDRITVLEGDANVLSHVSGLFDVVLANINRNILLADMPAFVDVMNSGATLLLSGFYADDVPLLEEKASSLGLTLQFQHSNGDWQCLSFRK